MCMLERPAAGSIYLAARPGVIPPVMRSTTGIAGQPSRYLGSCSPHNRWSLKLLLVGRRGAARRPGRPAARSAGHSRRTTPRRHRGVTVTFDRPVAGSLDRTVDPARIFRIEPAVAGTRRLARSGDPPVPPGRAAAGRARVHRHGRRRFAGDGRQPARAALHVHLPGARGPGARRHAGQPGERARFLTPDQRFELVRGRAGGFRGRGRDRVHRVREAVRRAGRGAARRWRSSGRSRRRSLGLPRGGRLGPRPLGRSRSAGWCGWRRARRCRSAAPASSWCRPRSTSAGGGELQRWEFATYGAVRARRGAPAAGDAATCPDRPGHLHFTTPVRGRRRAAAASRCGRRCAFTVADTADARAEWVAARAELQAAHRVCGRGRAVADRRLRPAAHRQSGRDAHHHRVRAVGRVCLRPRGGRAAGRAHLRRSPSSTWTRSRCWSRRCPTTLEAAFLARSEWNWRELWPALLPTRASAAGCRCAASGTGCGIYGVPLPAPGRARRRADPHARCRSPAPGSTALSRQHRPIALLQVTDLGVHARMGAEEAVGVGDRCGGRAARAAARPSRCTTSGGGCWPAPRPTPPGWRGCARYRAYPPPGEERAKSRGWSSFQGYVEVDARRRPRAARHQRLRSRPEPLALQRRLQAWGSGRLPAAAALFTERGIYRPGEPLYAKAIVRTGPLGALARPGRRATRCGWLFQDRADEDGEVGHAARHDRRALGLRHRASRRSGCRPTPRSASTASSAQLRREGRWMDLAAAWYRVAEYRPPEFLVDVAADSGARYRRGLGRRGTVEARYLFGAPMGRAAVRWTLRQQSLLYLGASRSRAPRASSSARAGWWYEELAGRSCPRCRSPASGLDTLDPAGRLGLRLPLGRDRARAAPRAPRSRPRSPTSTGRRCPPRPPRCVVHPPAFYLGAKPDGEELVLDRRQAGER